MARKKGSASNKGGIRLRGFGHPPRKRKRSTHNPALKATMRKRGKRIVHGYETAARKRKSSRRKK